ncbi:MAG: HNH endonuclease [Ignavibacteriaceae bacterium]|jgi:5-methylcytosine-specific restriction protein A|nr:HNH endonuclease [Ignavibacteriaceae bacterium]
MEITVEQYKDAINNSLSAKQIDILDLLYELPHSSATAKELAQIISPFNPNPVVASGQIRKIGKAFSEYLSFIPEMYFDGRKKAPAYFSLIGPYDSENGWRMNENLKRAIGFLTHSSKNKTYLVVWNPKRWTWDNIEESVEQVDLTGKCSFRWSCGNTKSIKPGERIFLVKVGTEPKGIIGAGFATTTSFPGRHWSGENKEAYYIDIDFEVLLNPEKELILTLDILKMGKLAEQSWTPQASGISIRPELVDELEALWFDFLTTQKIRHNPFIPFENGTQKTYIEGTPNQVTLTKYERNPFTRKKCIEHYGYSCVVCGFNFEKTYGQIGKDFIHVHHLQQVATVGKTYEVDPIKDLRPVCPNCHSIIHKRKTAFRIDELKEFMKFTSFLK